MTLNFPGDVIIPCAVARWPRKHDRRACEKAETDRITMKCTTKRTSSPTQCLKEKKQYTELARNCLNECLSSVGIRTITFDSRNRHRASKLAKWEINWGEGGLHWVVVERVPFRRWVSYDLHCVVYLTVILRQGRNCRFLPVHVPDERSSLVTMW